MTQKNAEHHRTDGQTNNNNNAAAVAAVIFHAIFEVVKYLCIENRLSHWANAN